MLHTFLRRLAGRLGEESSSIGGAARSLRESRLVRCDRLVDGGMVRIEGRNALRVPLGAPEGGK